MWPAESVPVVTAAAPSCACHWLAQDNRFELGEPSVNASEKTGGARPGDVTPRPNCRNVVALVEFAMLY